MRVTNPMPSDRGYVVKGTVKHVAPGETADLPDDAKLHSDLVVDSEEGTKDLTVEELTELAEAEGVMPETGTGKDGAVLKADIVKALEAGE